MVIEQRTLYLGLIGHQLLSYQHNMSTTTEMDRLYSEFLKAHNSYLVVFGDALIGTPTQIRSCDGSSSVQDMMTSDVKLQLDLIHSDSGKNKVVTGVKFMQISGVILIAIIEAELSPYRSVKNSTDVWKYSPNPEKNTITLGGRVILNFDDIKLPKNYLMTGIQFQRSGKPDGSDKDTAIELRIYGTPFNFTTGKLDYQNTEEFKPERISHVYEVQPTFSTASNITECSEPRGPNRGLNQFTRFVAHTYNGMNYVAPLFDNAPVANEPRLPLAGAGVFIKTHTNCEAFIAPRVYTIDYSEYFEDVKKKLARNNL